MENSNHSNDQINHWLTQWLVKQKKLLPEEIKPQKSIATYGIDSLDIIQLGKDIENFFKIKINWNDFSRYPTLDELSQYINNLLK